MPLPSDQPFEIHLAWSERTLKVGIGQSVLGVLLEAGVAVEQGCMSGGCGECMMEFVEGDVIHKDTCLTPSEREHHFCPCVSRARGTLVLPL